MFGHICGIWKNTYYKPASQNKRNRGLSNGGNARSSEIIDVNSRTILKSLIEDHWFRGRILLSVSFFSALKGLNDMSINRNATTNKTPALQGCGFATLAARLWY